MFAKLTSWRRAAQWGLGGMALLLAASGTQAADAAGRELLRSHCSGCHHETAGGFERISTIRKTPEGWVMTLFRMRQVHGLQLEAGVRDSLLRYLADTQGLAPAESAAGRFALERRPNHADLDAGPDIDGMCSRCHSLARSSLQRRDAEEWRKLAHTHVGQWPSIEYSASGRDRPWFQIATGPLPDRLAAIYPFASSAWSDWQRHAPSDLTGTWVVVGRVPGGKDFFGTAQIARDAGGDWAAAYDLSDAAGVARSGTSKAIVYTGYEWRGSAEIGTRSFREVYAVSEDGNRIAGRWFDPDHAEDGGEWTAVREAGGERVLAVLPRALRAGTAADVIVVGTGLGGAAAGVPSFGAGTTVSDVRRDAHSLRAHVSIAADAAPGLRRVSLGAASRPAVAGGPGVVRAVAAAADSDGIAIYTQIDRIEVVPGYAIARVGGGRIAPVFAQFEALASTRLPGGEVLALGPVAAQWTSAPFDAEARRTEDDKFAGHFDLRGRFLPGGAGPNPAREYSGDNVGNLTVVARAADGSKAVEGQGHLIVTVQRWNTPPLY